MKASKQSLLGQTNAQRLGLAVLFGCIVVPIVLVALVNSNSHRFAIMSLQLSIRTYGPLYTMEEEASASQQTGGNNLTSLPLQLRVVQERNDSITDIEKQNGNGLMDIEMEKPQDGNETVIGNKEAKVPDVSSDGQNDKSSKASEKIELPTDLNEKRADDNKVLDNKHEEVPLVSSDQAEHTVEGNNVHQGSKLECDFSGQRSDTCSMQGDIRIPTKSSTIFLASSSGYNLTAKIRPYARKWEPPLMQQINEITVTPLSDTDSAPSCSVNHPVPAVVFSTGGFLGNFFHDFTDVLVPLFVTSRHFQGEVQFLVTDFNTKWINKYRPILKQLSRHKIINMDSDTKVHCYGEAHLGLLSHKVLGIDPSKTPNGYSMLDFKQFLRSCFNLNKESAKPIPKKSRKKPRLLMVLRRGSRSLMNAKEVVAMAKSIGYKVIAAGLEDTRDIAKFSRIVNSCDVMMGVHGAGLANMVFLPANSSLVQIIPWGGLKYACSHDFGEPAPDMGINYVEYEIKEEESSLIEEYPRDHAVFTDPMSIHRQGWNMLWSIFLDKQKVKLDVGRFRGVLSEIYRTLKK